MECGIQFTDDITHDDASGKFFNTDDITHDEASGVSGNGLYEVSWETHTERDGGHGVLVSRVV